MVLIEDFASAVVGNKTAWLNKNSEPYKLQTSILELIKFRKYFSFSSQSYRNLYLML